MKKNLYITLLFFFASYNFVNAYTFSQNLYLGTEGEDVYQLQKILNSNINTIISTTGDGSKGNETYFFGEKTKQAVVKFQNLYKETILTPYNLSEGTGYVGTTTLNVLNSIQYSTTDNTVRTNIIPQFLLSTTKIQNNTSLYVGSNNDLKKDVKFYFNEKELKKNCKTNYTCEIIIPKKFKTGIYTLKTNNDLWGSYQVTVLSSLEKKPEINIKSLSLTKENIIKGKNFSQKMKIITALGIFETETKNNSFILQFPKEYITNATTTSTGLFYLENSNGLTSEINIIKYEI